MKLGLTEYTKKVKYEINIGLGDKSTKTEIERADDIVEMIENYMSRLEIGYSMSVGEGGSAYTDGRYAPEHSIYIIMIDAEYERVTKICRALKMLLNQESVLLTKHYVEVAYI